MRAEPARRRSAGRPGQCGNGHRTQGAQRRCRRDRPRRSGRARPQGRGRADDRRPRGTAGRRHHRPVPFAQARVLRTKQGGRAARRLEGLHQGIPRPPQDPDRRLPHVHESDVRCGVGQRHEAADRREGERPCCRQGRHHRDERARGARRGPRHVRRPVRRRRQRDRHRAVPRRRGSELHRDGRWQARAADGHLAGSQAPARQRRRAQHRRHGRVFARAGGHRSGARAGDARGDRTDARRSRSRRHALHRVPVRGPDDRFVRRAARHRIQRALRRSGNPAGADAAQVRPGRSCARPRSPASSTASTPTGIHALRSAS